VVLSSLPSAAAAPDGAAAQKRPVAVPWRPHTWHPAAVLTAGSVSTASIAPAPIRPATAGAAGIRVEPEDGAAPTRTEDLAALMAARREALARVPVRMHPDGSRHAVVGGLVRAYTVAQIHADGPLR